MKKIFYLGVFLCLALSTYRCDKPDDSTAGNGGSDTTTTQPSDTTTTPVVPDKEPVYGPDSSTVAPAPGFAGDGGEI